MKNYNEYLLESKLNELILEYNIGDTINFDTDDNINKYVKYLKNIISKISKEKAINILNKLITKVLNISKGMPTKSFSSQEQGQIR